MKRVMAVVFASVLIASAAGMARDKATWSIAKGTQIGVVSLLDPEVMHYHSVRSRPFKPPT